MYSDVCRCFRAQAWVHLRVFRMATCLHCRLPMGPERGFILPQMTPPERLMRAGQAENREENQGGDKEGFDNQNTQGENERGWLSTMKQHQALCSRVCHLKIPRSLLIGGRFKPNPGREQEGAAENISATMFSVVRPNHKYIFCLFSPHSKHALSTEWQQQWEVSCLALAVFICEDVLITNYRPISCSNDRIGWYIHTHRQWTWLPDIGLPFKKGNLVQGLKEILFKVWSLNMNENDTSQT